MGIYFCIDPLCWLFSNWSNYGYYQQFFQFMPDSLIPWRYSFSLLLRITSIACGLGIILRKDIFRRILVGICVFNIVTIYWKHPPYAIQNVVNNFLLFMPFLFPAGAENLVFNIFLLMIYGMDFIIFGIFIYYFTRSGVKAQFR